MGPSPAIELPVMLACEPALSTIMPVFWYVAMTLLVISAVPEVDQ